jgi:hypothetical protein
LETDVKAKTQKAEPVKSRVAPKTAVAPRPARRASHSPGRPQAPKPAAKPKVQTPPAVTSPVAPPVPAAADAARCEERVLRELGRLRADLARLSAPPATAPEAALDDGALAVRRVLSDLLDKRLEAVLVAVVGAREALLSSGGAQAQERLDALIEQLGGTAFRAEPGEYFDPLIHALGAERQSMDLPDGVIAETLMPGVRTPRGAIAAKAVVGVNRRA